VPHRRRADPRPASARPPPFVNAQWIIVAVVLLVWNFYLGSRATAPSSRNPRPVQPFFLNRLTTVTSRISPQGNGDPREPSRRNMPVRGVAATLRFRRNSSPLPTTIAHVAAAPGEARRRERAGRFDSERLGGRTCSSASGRRSSSSSSLLLDHAPARATCRNVLGSFGRSRARLYQPRATHHVCGRRLDRRGESELTEVVDFLRHPEKYQKLGGPHPPLSAAPPLRSAGHGQDELAPSVAGEATFRFFSLRRPSSRGESSRRRGVTVRDPLYQATEAAPSIVFIDELDAIVGGPGHGRPGCRLQRRNDER